MFLQIDDVRAFLQAPAADEEKLFECAEAACGKVEALCGVILPQIMTETVRVENGIAPVSHHVLTAPDGWLPTSSPWRWRVGGPDGWRTVTYDAGYRGVPPWAASAGRAIARQLWRTQLGPARREEPGVPAGFLVPNLASELMADHVRPAGC